MNVDHQSAQVAFLFYFSPSVSALVQASLPSVFQVGPIRITFEKRGKMTAEFKMLRLIPHPKKKVIMIVDKAVGVQFNGRADILVEQRKKQFVIA